MTGAPEAIAPPIVGTGRCGSCTNSRASGLEGGVSPRLPSACRWNGVIRMAGSGQLAALRPFPPWSNRPLEDRKRTRLHYSQSCEHRMPSYAGNKKYTDRKEIHTDTYD